MPVPGSGQRRAVEPDGRRDGAGSGSGRLSADRRVAGDHAADAHIGGDFRPLSCVQVLFSCHHSGHGIRNSMGQFVRCVLTDAMGGDESAGNFAEHLASCSRQSSRRKVAAAAAAMRVDERLASSLSPAFSACSSGPDPLRLPCLRTMLFHSDFPHND